MIAFGIIFMAISSQVKIILPYSPVPITGQTFAVAMIGLNFNKQNSIKIIAFYLVLGFLGNPIFSVTNLTSLATSGYLIGMLFSVAAISTIKQKMKVNNFMNNLLTCYIGSIITFLCGLLVLSNFVDSTLLLSAGLYPFLIGDLLKNTLASLISKYI